jgi:hypothetical protein
VTAGARAVTRPVLVADRTREVWFEAVLAG